METLFDKIAADPSTLAANIVRHAHDSIIAWAKARGIKAEFSTADYLNDYAKMEECLMRKAKQNGSVVFEPTLSAPLPKPPKEETE